MKNIQIIITFILLISVAGAADHVSGRVVRVADGDTITVLDADNVQHKIRLYGIDAPEKKQAFGNASGDNLAGYVAGKEVTVEVHDIDRYGREVGVVYVEGLNVNERQIMDGMAWVYERYCKLDFCGYWFLYQADSMENKRGLWKEAATPPWEWRRR